MNPMCLHPHPSRAIKCDQERGHEGDHGWSARGGEPTDFWPNDRAKPKPRKPRAPMQRGKGPRQESVKHQLLNAKWAGLREATIYWLNRLDPDGVHCMECGRKARRYELHHVIPRSKSGHYSMSNAILLCAGPGSCHERAHGAPQWSESA